MPAPVTILIPNFNGEKFLEDCVTSALRQSLAPSEVLVVDDASTDRSPELAAQLGSRVLSLSHNHGFAHAVNSGVTDSSTEWVAIVNSDVVLADDWLAELLDSAQASNAAYACGPITRCEDVTIMDGSYDLLSRAACPWRAGSGFPIAEMRLPGGYWSPSFTALLILHKRDCRGVFVPTALATHLGSATFGAWSARSTRLLSRNQLLLVARHYPDGWFRRFGRAVVAGQLLWGILALSQGVFPAWFAGKLDALRIWSEIRARSTPMDSSWLTSRLESGEREILAWQSQPPRDWYWRWYFRLAGSPGRD